MENLILKQDKHGQIPSPLSLSMFQVNQKMKIQRNKDHYTL